MSNCYPLISVILPIYNAGPYLDQCLVSVEQQSYRNLEIICLNDGSTDNSLDIMQTHALHDDRIVIINKQNQGYGATCNRGLDEAHGDYIAIVEPDDWIESQMYEDMLRFAMSFDQWESIEIVKTPFWRIWFPDTPEQRKFNCSYKSRVTPQRQPFTLADTPTILHHHPSIWSAIYRKDFLDSHRIRFMEIPGAGWADNPFLIETLCQAKKIVYLDKPYYCYREDTPEKLAAFAHRSTLLPIERWNDMLDVMERLQIADRNILSALYSRGFTYVSGVIEEVDLSHSDVRDAVTAMFERMDENIVFSSKHLSPGCKRLFADLRNLPRPKINHLQYAKELIGQGVYNFKNTGLSNTIYAVTNYLKKYRKRTGGK